MKPISETHETGETGETRGETRETRAMSPGGLPARALGAAVGLLTLAGIVAGSHGRLSGFTRADAVVRVAWSARPERIEHCRRLTEEELVKQLAHMRTRVECVGTTARYRLEVKRDGVLVDSVTVRGGGMRHDRELYLLREIAVAPGAARFAVRFVRVDSSTASEPDVAPDTLGTPPGAVWTAGAAEAAGAAVLQDSARTPALADRAVREEDERRRRRAEAISPLLALDTTVTLPPRTVLLVTYDAAGRRLVVRRGK